MKIGFTGTQQGMTVIQLLSVAKLIQGSDEFHHGDCVGADAEAHSIAWLLETSIIKHPPDDDKKRAFSRGGKEVEPKPYLVRNRDIVDATDVLIAAPSGPETVRSGTWSTVRYAAKQKKSIFVIMPDGSAG